MLPLLLPERLTLGPKWLLPAAQALFLIAIVVRDPGRIDNRSGAMRRLSIGLLGLFIVGDLTMTTVLVDELIHGGPKLNEAGPLLATGATIWVYNNVLFGLLYRKLDGGGPAQRAFSPKRYPDLAFPEHMNPEIRPPDWRPVFLDYLLSGSPTASPSAPSTSCPAPTGRRPRWRSSPWFLSRSSAS